MTTPSDTEQNTAETQPSSPSKDWKRLSPVAIAYFIVSILKQTAQHAWQALAPLFFLIVSKGFDIWWFALGGSVFVVAVITLAIFKYFYFRFSLSETSFLIRSGVINKKQLNLTFDRIQNIEIKQPIYFRPFQLSVLSLESAGSSSEEVNLAGIPYELAESVKQDVINRQHQTATHVDDTQQEDNTAHRSEGPVLAQDLKSLIKHGISNNNIWIFAGILAPILNQFEESLSWLITPEIRSTYEEIEALGPAALIGSTIFLGLIILGILMLLSAIASIVIYYDYKLFRSNGRLSRQNGLLEKQQASMEESKVQRILIRQSAIGYLLGCFSMTFKQIGFARNAAQHSKSFLIPALNIRGYKNISQMIYEDFKWKGLKTKTIHVMYIQRSILLASIPLLVISIILSLSFGPIGFLLMGVLIPLTPIFIQKKKRFRYALNGDYALIQSGFIGKSISVFPLYKVQNVRVRQSPGQRRKGLASLKVNIAGQTLTVPYIPITDANNWRNIILAKVERSTRSWM
jgi:putative membrane protein